jgi:transcriptional regulator with XRE-family HTH domain
MVRSMTETRNSRQHWVELRVIRTRDGHSLTSLADAAGISLSYLSELESGARKPNPRMIKRLAEALKVPFSMLQPHVESTRTGDAA